MTVQQWQALFVRAASQETAVTGKRYKPGTLGGHEGVVAYYIQQRYGGLRFRAKALNGEELMWNQLPDGRLLDFTRPNGKPRYNSGELVDDFRIPPPRYQVFTDRVNALLVKR